VAVGKKVVASSLHHKHWLPNNVVDGNNNQNVLDGATCVTTNKERKPYLTIDLADEYNLTDVKVYKRSDCCRKYSITYIHLKEKKEMTRDIFKLN
jgi:hypothetical protein